MKRLRPEFIIIALSAALFAWGCLASSAFAAEPCIPIEAGGSGTEYTRVVHLDHRVVIRTFMCSGQPTWVFEKYEGAAPDEPANAKDLAALLQRLRPKAAELKNRLLYEDLAREQLRLYKPAESFKNRGKVRHV